MAPSANYFGLRQFKDPCCLHELRWVACWMLTRETLVTAPALAFFIFCLVGLVGPAYAEPGESSDMGSPLSKPADNTLGNQQEQITVWGHRRKFSLAPTPNNQVPEPGSRPAFGPGSQLGIVKIEGGPIHGAASDGVSLGLAVPMPDIKGLDFTASLSGTRDTLSPAGTTGAAAAVMGFRLKF